MIKHALKISIKYQVDDSLLCLETLEKNLMTVAYHCLKVVLLAMLQ